MKEIESIYDSKFYSEQHKTSYISACEVINEIKGLVPQIDSVVDVGCGVGTWLKAWRDVDLGIRILGVDGNSVNDEMYYIPKESYKQVDLCSDANLVLSDIVDMGG